MTIKEGDNTVVDNVSVSLSTESGLSYLYFTGMNYGNVATTPVSTVTIDNLSITEGAASTDTPVNYSVKYFCGDTEIKNAATRSGVVGGTAAVLDADKATFTSGGKKYVFDSNNTNNVLSITSLDATAANNVLKLYFTEATAVTSIKVDYKYNGSVIATDNISTTDCFVGDSKVIPFRAYIKGDDGKLYSTTANTSGNYYGDTKTLAAENAYEKDLTLVDLNGGTIAFFKDFDNSTSNNADTRASYCAAIDNTAFESDEQLSAGVYKLIVRCQNKDRGSSIKIGNTTIPIAYLGSKNSWETTTLYNVNVPTAGKLSFVKGGSNTYDDYDVIIAIKTGAVAGEEIVRNGLFGSNMNYWTSSQIDGTNADFTRVNNDAAFGEQATYAQSFLYTSGVKSTRSADVTLSQTTLPLPAGYYTFSAKAYSDCGATITFAGQTIEITGGAAATTYTKSFKLDAAAAVTITYTGKAASDKDRIWDALTGVSLKYAGNASASMECKSQKMGTFCAPFAVTLPENIKAYSATADATSLTLTKIGENKATLTACTPVVIYNEGSTDLSTTLYGVGTETSETCNAGALTGMFTTWLVPSGSYVLATNNNVQGFYKVDSSGLKGKANRCYVTAGGSGAKLAINFSNDEMTTAINVLEQTPESKTVTMKRIQNGKLVIETANGTYSASGARIK